MSVPKPEITEVTRIGENDHGYWFGVGRINERWVGFAAGQTSEGLCYFFLPGISDGACTGLPDRDKVIRMTGAIAQDPEHGYGGVERWFVREDLRGRPEDFRCAECGSVGCDGEHYYDDYDYPL